MTDAQIKTFATRCGRLMKDYGPAVIDTFGQTSFTNNAGADSPSDHTVSVLQNFSRYVGDLVVKPLRLRQSSFCVNLLLLSPLTLGVTSVLNVVGIGIISYAAAGGVPPQLYLEQPTGNIKYAYHKCNPTKLNTWLDDGTPVICTQGDVFYVMGSLGGDTLAQRVNAIAKQGTQFITVRPCDKRSTLVFCCFP